MVLVLVMNTVVLSRDFGLIYTNKMNMQIHKDTAAVTTAANYYYSGLSHNLPIVHG